MSLTIYIRELDTVTVVDLKGRIVFGEEANLLRDKVRPLLAEKKRPVVLNLSEVAYIDSGGVGALVGLYTTSQSSKTNMRLACANPKVEHVLKITKLLPILGAYPDESSAICSCTQKSAIA